MPFFYRICGGLVWLIVGSVVAAPVMNLEGHTRLLSCLITMIEFGSSRSPSFIMFELWRLG